VIFFAKLVVVKGRLLKADECTLKKLRLDYSQKYQVNQMKLPSHEGS